MPGTRLPSQRKRQASREQSRDDLRDPPRRQVKELADIIKELQDTVKEMRNEIKDLRQENAALKTNTEKPVKTDGTKPLGDIDRKDVEKPAKFKGDPMQWRTWSLKFKTFLARRDGRWPKFIEAIQDKSDEPMNMEGERKIFKDMGIDVEEMAGEELAEQFKVQFQEYLENYTEGAAHSMIEIAGASKVMETFRVMCDEGHSKRHRHLKKEYRVVTNPKQASFETLRQAIATWETDLAEYETAAGNRIDDRTRLLCLEDLCPDLLQQHLASKDNLQTYAGYKAVINDYLIERKRWTAPGSKARLNWLGQAEKPDEEDDEEWQSQENGDGEAQMDVESIMGEMKQTLMALVKSRFDKKPKGGGKGRDGKQPGKGNARDGKDGGTKNPKAMDVDGPACYECGEPMAKCGHSAKDCPIRKARVAAGGPERLPKGAGKGNGKDGKGAWPTKQMWSNFYPGPTQTQWRGWYPQQPAAAQNRKLNLFGQPVPQSDVSSLQALLNGPTAYGIRPKKTVPMAVKEQATGKEFTHKNSFDALAEYEKPEEMVVQLSDAIKQPSRNRVRKLAKANAVSGEVRSSTGTAGGSSPDTKAAIQNNKATATATRRNGNATATHPFVPKSTCWSAGKDGMRQHCAPETASTSAPIQSMLQQMLNFVNNPQADHTTIPRHGLRCLNPAALQSSLKPLSVKQTVDALGGQFEVLSSIVDSGATIPTMHPGDAKAYELQESEASRRGVEYEVANGETVPNLGEKKFAVLTKEGTLRGYQTQCAEVVRGKPLQAVRALLASRHAVCFGLGEAGDQNLIINKDTGEINEMRDDGINYIQDVLVIPADKIEEVQQQLAALRERDDLNGQDFGRQGR